jgi:hypothetical protein
MKYRQSRSVVLYLQLLSRPNSSSHPALQIQRVAMDACCWPSAGHRSHDYGHRLPWTAMSESLFSGHSACVMTGTRTLSGTQSP